jgi:hypothetical protein
MRRCTATKGAARGLLERPLMGHDLPPITSRRCVRLRDASFAGRCGLIYIWNFPRWPGFAPLFLGRQPGPALSRRALRHPKPMLRCPIAARHRIQIPLQAASPQLLRPAEMLRHPKSPLSAVAGSEGFAPRWGRLFSDRPDAGGGKGNRAYQIGRRAECFRIGVAQRFQRCDKVPAQSGFSR